MKKSSDLFIQKNLNVMIFFEKFKKLAQEQNRTAGNLGTKLLKDYVKENYKDR